MLGLRPVYSDATQLDVELNCVAINGPLQSTGKELTIGLVGTGHAADRGIIDYRDNIATFTKARTYRYSLYEIYLLNDSPLSLQLHNSCKEPGFLTLLYIHQFQILIFHFAHFPDALRYNGHVVQRRYCH